MAAVSLPLVVSVAGAPARTPDPRKAAAALVARMHPARVRARGCTFASSRVVSRRRRLWLAVGSTCYPKGATRTRVRIFRWSGRAWRADGSVTGPLGPSQWLHAAALTGSRAPDFTIEGCGAGNNSCLSVVSRRGGRWHAVPFVYGFDGTSLEVNGVPFGHHVLTKVFSDLLTWMPERYVHGVFVPTDPPGRRPRCSTTGLELAALRSEDRGVRFERASCAAGWALAVGDGAGFTGPAVGLFERSLDGRSWRLLRLDNGNVLPAAPAVYDLPLPVLARLAAPFGATLAPHLAASRLIAQLQSQYDFYWALRNGIVEAGGARWLIAVVPVGPAKDDESPAPVGAIVYRWDGTRWLEDGRVPRLSHHLNVDWWGGWFVSVPQPEPSAVAFQLDGACCQGPELDHGRSTGVITDAGGHWHVAAPAPG